MGYKSSSTRRATATSAQSNQTATIYTGSGYSVAGAAVTGSTSVSLGVITPGSTSSASAVSVVGGGGPTITSVQYLDANNAVISGDIAVSTAGGNILINGSGFVSGSSVFVNNSLVSNTFISSTQIRAILPSASAGNVNLMIFGPTNSGTLATNAVRYSGVPTWTTSAVSFQNAAAGNVALVASSDSTLTYTLQAGSTLPTGISLISSGYLSGTPTGYASTTTVTVVVIATDTEGQATQQTINITISGIDPQFPYVTLLLNGDTGSNNANTATNSTFLDSSSNNATITRNGNATQGSYTPFSPNGWSNFFSGTTDCFTFPDTTATRIATSNFTVEGWLYKYDNATSMSVVTVGPASVAGGGAIFYSPATRLKWMTGQGTLVLQDTTDFPLNQWVHFAFVRSGTTLSLYVNGTFKASAAYSTSLNPAGGQVGYIAKWIDGTNFLYKGYISNLRIVNGTALYNADFTPPAAPLTAVANTAVLTCQSSSFVDKSSNNLTLTAAGNPIVQAYSPFSPSAPYTPSSHGGSAYFDGTGDSLLIPDSSAMQLGSSNFTVEGWFNSTQAASNQSIVSLCANGTTNYISAVYVYIVSTNVLRLQVSENGTTFLTAVDSAAILTNTWYHFAVVRNGQTITLYLNGVAAGSVNTTTAGTALVAGTYHYVGTGKTTTGTARDMSGYLSDIRLTKGYALYTTAFTPPVAPLTSPVGTPSTLLLNFTNGGIVDAHGGVSFETVGQSQLSTSVKKYGNASMYFDGAGDYIQSPSNQMFNLGTGDFTIEFWHYTIAKTQLYPSLFSNQATATYAANKFAFYDRHNDNPTKYGLYVYNFSSTTPVIVSTFTPQNGQWYHVALSRSGSNFRLFINGSLDTTYINAGSIDGGVAQPWSIGLSDVAATAYNGYIDDFRITRGFARYTANFTPPTSSLLGQ